MSRTHRGSKWTPDFPRERREIYDDSPRASTPGLGTREYRVLCYQGRRGSGLASLPRSPILIGD